MSGLPATVPYRIAGRRVEVMEPLDLGGEGRETAEAVGFLRECQGLGLSVRWRATGSPAYDLGVLRHLPPPAELACSPSESARWRSGYTFGTLYHRRGPGFVTVLDRRREGTAVRLTLDHPDLHATFLRLLTTTPLDALGTTEREAVALLAAERLVLVAGGWAVTLPPRVRQWPVPCTAI
ncbi:hypothetical protein SAMN05428944_2163 [Streptomyces sp. 1222.5]|uniref:DUF5825 family protein n=1 Tax=unclassified Streptomyces TaxID=2593676 RepID=UPI00089B670F|nr:MULTISPECIES: DUF5825 family protein [unclassified Streptomyces]PKW10637.1 hypothetical protein BX260_5931 [Streptomyces sp. 5112.2]SEC00675.1 hypothetical protein SAMN05428944_2163 [Streptomyces sp. 1222.5]